MSPSKAAAQAPTQTTTNSTDVFADFVAPPVKLFETAARLVHQPAYWTRDAQGWQATSWQLYAEQVHQAARALLTLGVERGDAVAILSFNCPAWSITAFAAMSIGAFPVGIYWTSSSADIAYILDDSQARVLIVEDEARMARVAGCLQESLHLRSIVQIQGEPLSSANRQTLSWCAFMALGSMPGAAALGATVQKRLASLQSSDTGTLIYTSGTTGTATSGGWPTP
jgi:long-chain acyl-CoA synthetase